MMLDVATEHWGIMVERVEMWVGKQSNIIGITRYFGVCFLYINQLYDCFLVHENDDN